MLITKTLLWDSKDSWVEAVPQAEHIRHRRYVLCGLGVDLVFGKQDKSQYLEIQVTDEMPKTFIEGQAIVKFVMDQRLTAALPCEYWVKMIKRTRQSHDRDYTRTIDVVEQLQGYCEDMEDTTIYSRFAQMLNQLEGDTFYMRVRPTCYPHELRTSGDVNQAIYGFAQSE